MAFAMNFNYGNGNIHWMDTPGKRLRALRIERQLTQVGLADLTGIDQSTISDIERDRGLSAEYMMRLCEALDTTPQYVMRGKPAEDTILLQIKELLGTTAPVNPTSAGKHLAPQGAAERKMNAPAMIEPGMQPELTSGQRVGRGTPNVRVKPKPAPKQRANKSS